MRFLAQSITVSLVRMRRQFIVTLGAMIALLGMAVLAPPAHSQAGSTGGTIGKQGKSISGGEEQTKPTSRAQRRTPPADQRLNEKQVFPRSIRLNERSIGGSYSATLRHVRNNIYEATWNVPIVSRMTVSLTEGSMIIHRQDTSNASGPLWSGTYSGTRRGNSASGTYNAPLNRGSWDASW